MFLPERNTWVDEMEHTSGGMLLKYLAAADKWIVISKNKLYDEDYVEGITYPYLGTLVKYNEEIFRSKRNNVNSIPGSNLVDWECATGTQRPPMGSVPAHTDAPYRILSNLPTTNVYPGLMVYLTSESKTYQWHSTVGDDGVWIEIK